MKILRRVLRLFWRLFLGFVCLSFVLIMFSRLDRTVLPNGLKLGRQYLWDAPNDLYLWTADGDLIAPYPVEFLCFNDRYIRATGYGDPSFIYDIERDELTLSNSDEYYPLRRASDLSRRTGGCNGYTEANTGARMFELFPSTYRNCTLSEPCRFNESVWR